MRILSIRRGYDADHSSSTYEFFSLNGLTSEQYDAVEKLTGQSASNHLIFNYRGEFHDIHRSWTEKLLTMGYDILVSESYDWWEVQLSLPHKPDLLKRLQEYECDSESNGFGISVVRDSMILSFGMQLDYGAAYHYLGQDPFEGLAKLFKRVRTELLKGKGNMSVPWAMYHVYGDAENEDEMELLRPNKISAVAEKLLDMMERL